MPKNSFEEALRFTLKEEGGLNPNEPGGRVSNFGILQSTLNAFREQRGLEPMNVRDLKPSQAKELLQDEFWKRPGFGQLPKKLARATFDFGVQASPRVAIKSLQNLVGTREDGILGPKTLAAIERVNEKDLVKALGESRLSFIQRLIKANPTKFAGQVKGIPNRIKRLENG